MTAICRNGFGDNWGGCQYDFVCEADSILDCPAVKVWVQLRQQEYAFGVFWRFWLDER